MEGLFKEALEYATLKHQGMKRKDGSDYITHPIEVTTIANTITNDEEVLSTCMLHDVPEECDVSIDEIKKLFGDRVGKLVDLETEPKYSDIPKKESWILRKTEAIRRLNTTDDIGFKIVYLSDKLANLRSLYKDYQVNGLHAFDKFNVNDVNQQAWYYCSVLDELSELKDTEAYKEYEKYINEIFKDYRRDNNNGKNSNTL